MKRLKYKAWNKKEKRMYPVFSIDFARKEVSVDTIAIGKNYKERIPVLTYRYPDEVVLIQFTGRKDSTGREIYEGDVVQCGNIVGVVEWDSIGYCVMIKDPIPEMKYGASPLSPHSEKNTVVLGNAYERPELIGAVQYRQGKPW